MDLATPYTHAVSHDMSLPPGSLPLLLRSGLSVPTVCPVLTVVLLWDDCFLPVHVWLVPCPERAHGDRTPGVSPGLGLSHSRV